jgi:flagellar biosynthesis/type III secretory pathway ATPase
VIGRSVGAVVATRGHLVEAELPFARIGDGVRVCARDVAVNARVVAVSARPARAHETRAMLSPFSPLDGVASGDWVVRSMQPAIRLTDDRCRAALASRSLCRRKR